MRNVAILIDTTTHNVVLTSRTVPPSFISLRPLISETFTFTELRTILAPFEKSILSRNKSYLIDLATNLIVKGRLHLDVCISNTPQA